MKIELHNDDCFNVFKTIESGSVDLVLCDPPYGTINGIAGGEKVKHGLKNSADWDCELEPHSIFTECERVLRPNGSLILFSQEPYTSNLITSAIPAVPFSYRLMWVKDHFANALLAKKAPLSYFEDICVFFKKHDKHDFEGFHPLRLYAEKIIKYIGLTKRQIEDKLGHQKADHFLRVNSSQFSLCTEGTYNELVNLFGLSNMPDFMQFNEMSDVNKLYRQSLIEKMTLKNPRVFNLAEGAKFKSNILDYKKDYTGLHPTQKPVALMADLIRTYSNNGDAVLDFTMGSGSTGVACVNEGRNFIGIEQDFKYFRIARQRIKEAGGEL